ncbi:MAG: hypothetical protein N2170_04990 [Bacteroidia bacterium]|nr:hypothetical protein [Bacteroidia bacterium]
MKWGWGRLFMWYSPPIRAKWIWGLLGLGVGQGQVVEIDTLFSERVVCWALPQGWLLPNGVQTSPSTTWRYDTVAHALCWSDAPETMRVRVRLYLLPHLNSLYEPLPWSALEKWDSLMSSSRLAASPFMEKEVRDTFSSRLNRSGSLIRSLTVGTGQNATLNSAFRLNLEGLIAPDLYLIAALTDENLPFQTAATQAISDFDRVSIGLRWRSSQLLLGDLELRETRSQFANFYRNVLGGELKSTVGRHRPHLAFAEAKGRFHTNSFMGQEGRQGPYPLTGKNGERFIPILAGSEKVYINGVLMRRGQDQDYVIDYTVGEITFTPRVPITAATRVVVDFEYADRSYGRSFIWLEDTWSRESLQVTVSYFRQADNPRRPLDFSLSPEEERFLASLPMGRTVGLLPGVDTLPYEAGAIRYAVRDTLIGGDTLRYFVRSQDPAQALYQVSFVFVGGGRGDYVREPSSLNGNAFRWVGPGAGDYIVGRVVPLPTSVEVLSFRHQWNGPKRISWSGELNGSRYSENRFAGRSQQDVAFRQVFRWQVRPDTSLWQASPELAFQYVGARYQNADRVYEREYGRVWNFNDLGTRAVERLAEIRLPLRWKNRYRLTPNLGWRSWGDSLRTSRYALLWEGLDTLHGLGGQYLLEYIPSVSRGGSDKWLRHTGKVFYTYGKWQGGAAIWAEARQSGLLDTANFRFWEYTPYLRYQGARLSFRVGYQWRREWQRPARELTPRLALRFQSHMPQIEMSYQRVKWSFSTLTSYRIFLPGDSVFQLLFTRVLLSQNTLRLRLRPWEVEGFYQLSSEQTPQRQVLFVAVNPGQGTHEWRDLNGDGLQQIEEFFPAVNPLIANFIRVQRATGRFLPAIALSTAFSLRWQPEKRLRWLGYQVNTRLEQRQNAPDARWTRYIPSPPRMDTTFLQWNLLHRQDLFLFRTATKGDQTFAFQYQLSQFVPLSGLQRQITRQYTSRSRYNFSRVVGGEFLIVYTQKVSQAPQQGDLNYAHEGIEFYPQGIYQPTVKWRTSIGVAYRDKRGTALQSFRLRGVRFPIEQRWTWKAGAFVGVRVEPAFFRASVTLPPLLSFDLLEGMQPGRNLFASLNLNWPLNRFIELSLLYEGRFGEREPFHSARMQARANF